jgi:hypothetical protein
MTESEYIAATNLAKLRLAHHTLYDVLLLKADEAIEQRKALDIIRTLIERHEAQVEKMTHA